MIAKKVLKIMVVSLAMMCIAACGSSGSGDGDATNADTGDTMASAVDTAVTASVTNLMTVMEDMQGAPQDVVAAMTARKAVMIKTGKTTITPADCDWLDASGNELSHATAEEMMASLNLVVSWRCESACTGGGTETLEISNGADTPLFSEETLTSGMVMSTAYDGCPVENACGTNTLDGTITIAITGLDSNPCDIVITVVSDAMTVDGNSPAATVDLTMNITAAGDCSTMTGEVECESMLSEDSTLSDGVTTWNKDDICDMIDNPSC